MRIEWMRQRTAAKVLDAAETLLVKGGLDKMKLEDVAKEAKVSWRTVYGHFAGRDHVIVSLCARRQAACVRSIRKALGRRTSNANCWKKVFGNLTDWCMANGELLAETQAAMSRGAVVHEYALQDSEQTMQDLLEELFSRAQSQREIRSDLDAALLSKCVLGMLLANAVGRQGTKKKGGKRHTDHLVTFFVNGAQRKKAK